MPSHAPPPHETSWLKVTPVSVQSWLPSTGGATYAVLPPVVLCPLKLITVSARAALVIAAHAARSTCFFIFHSFRL
ncbi:MAG: hypothetical protein DRP64_11965 [Verrucomicrobia bacterium]|nr:MAG: hypothetical protein DRP64_11965 [Verrucomicrobiota bacterium]